MLEPTFFEYRHRQAGYGFDAAADDQALERIQFLVIPAGEFDERNALGDFDDVRHRIGTESLESEHSGRSVGAHVTATLAATVGQGVLDLVDPPAFLVQHRVVEHAAYRQLRVGLDRIILEVLIAAIAVDQVLPVGVAFPDSAAQRQRHCGRLHVERLVILRGGDSLVEAHVVSRNLDRLEEHAEAEPIEKLPRLLRIRTVAVYAQRKCFQARR